MRKIIIVSAGLLMLGGCAAKVDLNDYQVTDQDKQMASHTLPAYVVSGRKPRVAVLPGKNATSFKQCSLNENLTEQMTTMVASLGTYKVIERSQLGGLMNEVKFAASLGGGVDPRKLQALAKQIDYAVLISASGAQAKANFTEARSWTDDQGNSHYSPPSCTEKGKATVSVRIVEFPSGEIKKVIQEDGVETNSSETRWQSGCRVQNVCGLLSSAIGSALDEMKEEVASAAPVYGYIYKIRSHGKDRVASISLGTNHGVKAGSTLNVIQFDREDDPIKHTSVSVERVIATCEVSETALTADRAICQLKGDHVAQVKIKHAVRLQQSKSMLRKLKSGVNWLKDVGF